MDGIGPTDPWEKIPRLTPELRDFIKGMGMYFESQGLARIGGRVLGLLMIAHWPLSAEDLAKVLKRSRVSISANLRQLMQAGLVEKAPMPHTRRTYFAFCDDAMQNHIAASIKSTQDLRQLLQRAAEAVPTRDPARHHIDDSLQASNLILQAFDQALDKWHSHHPAHTHVHSDTTGG
jgi:DNA-binding transcriptional regulator GbsR (MarR family)